MTTRPNELAFVFGGGGARGAYQVGFLRFVARRYPDLPVQILTGVSAGAINAAHLASHRGSFADGVESLTRLWCELSVDRVFRTDGASLASQVLRWGAHLTLLGGRRGVAPVRGLVNTAPLRDFLGKAFGSDGRLPGIRENIQEGPLRALALTTTDYSTGQTVTWCEGREIEAWERPLRVSVRTELALEHVMASAALPLFFPAVRIGSSWYGDGGVRLHAPLAPATHLGAQRIVAISARHAASPSEVRRLRAAGYPPPAQVLGLLLNAVFLDLLDWDALNMTRVNQLLADRPATAPPSGLRRIELLVLRPSADLAAIASEYEPRLPRLFRFLTRRLGTREARSHDLLSLIMFQPDYLARLIEVGERDAEARADEIAALLEREA